jgi:hypothetical protein
MAKYKLKNFVKWQQSYNIDDSLLIEAAKAIDDAPKKGCLAKFLYKKRISGESSGKSSGHRVMVAARIGNNYFFMYGFAKNDKDNISDKELTAFKLMAKKYSSYGAEEIQFALTTSELEIIVEKESNDE